jgi:mannonate dehydratase
LDRGEYNQRDPSTAKAAGLVAYNAMINLPASVIYGKDTRAKDMEPFLASIEAAGKGGLTVVEYNFYAHRATEGYYETIGRANSGYTGFDYELELLIDENGRVLGPLYRDANGKLTEETLAAFPNAKKVKFKDLPPLANEGAHNLDEIWANITYFLKAAIPAAEKAGVRMALHPNDPPAPISRGSQQIMGTLAGWKRLIGIVDSPANGITFDCGVTRELGEDAVTTAEYFASRKRINHVHYRNVLVDKPYEKYQEVFIDAGMNDMFGVMKALVKNKYTGTIYPEHPRALDVDRDRGRIGGYPGGGGYTGITFSVAYARAMMQAALESRPKEAPHGERVQTTLYAGTANCRCRAGDGHHAARGRASASCGAGSGRDRLSAGRVGFPAGDRIAPTFVWRDAAEAASSLADRGAV